MIAERSARAKYAKLPTKVFVSCEIHLQKPKKMHGTECGICADNSKRSGYVIWILTVLTNEGCLLNVRGQAGLGQALNFLSNRAGETMLQCSSMIVRVLKEAHRRL